MWAEALALQAVCSTSVESQFSLFVLHESTDVA